MKRKKHDRAEHDAPKPIPTVGTKLKGLIEGVIQAEAKKKELAKAQPKSLAKGLPSGASKFTGGAGGKNAGKSVSTGTAPKLAKSAVAKTPDVQAKPGLVVPASEGMQVAPPLRPPSETLRGNDRIAYFDAIAGVRPIGAVKGKLRHEPSLGAVKKNPINVALVATERQTNEASARKKLGELLGGGYEFDIAVDEEDVLEALRRDAPIEALGALRKANPRIDATLDLHGMREAVVEDKLARWVREQHRKGARRLLIIHGKGLRSPQGVAVLRDCVRSTLASSIATPLVHAFASAPPDLGGTGATLVELGRS